jgi:hypothetical protein
MSKNSIAALAAGMLICASASAQDWFRFEAALGAVAYSPDSGPGQWQQPNNPTNKERLRTPAYMAGITGDIWQTGPWSLSYHLDYVYIGQFAASCMCVDDSNYDAKNERIIDPNGPRTSFVGLGHTQGVAFTLAPGYSWGKWRVQVEAGPFFYWPTWHETVNYTDTSFSHRTTMQVSYVVGARLNYGNFWLSYRYYDDRASWNPFPGLVEKSHVVSIGYTF